MQLNKDCKQKNQEFAAPKDILRFGTKFFVRSIGSRHLGEMKTSPNDEKKAPSNFSQMVNGHFKNTRKLQTLKVNNLGFLYKKNYTTYRLTVRSNRWA